MPLAGRAADVKVASLVATSSTDEVATLAGDALSVSINNTARTHWNPDGVVTVFANASTVGVGPYSVNNVQGIVNFETTQNSSAAWTLDVEYLTVASVAGGREWGLNVEADMFEVSTFGSSGWKQFQPNLNGAGVTIGRYWNDSTFIDYMTVDALFMVELTPNTVAGSTSARYEAFARVSADQHQASVDNIVTETINMVVDGALYYTT